MNKRNQKIFEKIITETYTSSNNFEAPKSVPASYPNG